MTKKYYYNLATGEVELGKLSRGLGRMGPYETMADAYNALAVAQKRNDAWDDEDAAWDAEDEEPQDS